MEQTFENRGKIAFLEDQVAMAAEAFRQNDFATVTSILQDVGAFIPEFLREANQKRQ